MQILERHGATVNQNGRELEAVFGHPLAHEDDAMRAVRAAYEIAEALAATDTPDPETAVAVLARVGIHTAEVVIEAGEAPVIDAIAAGPHDRCSRRTVAPRFWMPKPTRWSATR